MTFREGGADGYIDLTWDVVSIDPPADDDPPDYTSEAIRVSGDPTKDKYYVLLAIKDLLTARRARLGPWGQAPCRLRCLPSKRLSCVLACITLDHCDARV